MWIAIEHGQAYNQELDPAASEGILRHHGLFPLESKSVQRLSCIIQIQ